MKKTILMMSALACLFFAGCKEMTTPETEDNGNGKVETRYMAVNLVSSDVTRAAAGYEDGSAEENKVTKARFYFFDSNGSAANVKLVGNSYVNYYDWAPGDPQPNAPDNNDDVEKILGATIVINTQSGDKIPQMVAVVLNPADKLNNDSKDLQELKAIVNDYSKYVASGQFVMFNSVYGNNGEEFCAVPIEAENLQKNESAAIANPVRIYVERSVAKVEVRLGLQFDGGKLALKDKIDNGNPIVIDEQQVYLKLEGWGLTAETSNGNLVKDINPGWTSSWWNGSHRSFWAINSPSAINRYYSYDSIAEDNFDVKMYTNENAAKAEKKDGAAITPAEQNTKVILKGQLCKEDGTPFTIVRHLGAYFGDDDEFTNLRTSILNQLAMNTVYYYDAGKDLVNNSTVYKQIDIDDIEIVIADQKNNENSNNNCYVYAKLTDEATGKTWYNAVGENPSSVAASAINAALKDQEKVDRALLYKSGMTYYYYEIIQNKASETKGVVRNHWYKTNITGIAGLGTPVYDPTQTIYPEKPESNDHYIAAEIDILSWRIVSNDYALEW